MRTRIPFEFMKLTRFAGYRENKPNFLCGHPHRLWQSSSRRAEQINYTIYACYQHKHRVVNACQSTIPNKCTHFNLLASFSLHEKKSLHHHTDLAHSYTALKIHIPRSIKSQYNPEKRRNPITFSSATLDVISRLIHTPATWRNPNGNETIERHSMRPKASAKWVPIENCKNLSTRRSVDPARVGERILGGCEWNYLRVFVIWVYFFCYSREQFPDDENCSVCSVLILFNQLCLVLSYLSNFEITTWVPIKSSFNWGNHKLSKLWRQLFVSRVCKSF